MLILASNSPRRREILSKFNYSFVVKQAFIDENINLGEEAIAYVNRMSYLKAMDVYQSHKENIVIGLDTIVCLNNKIYGKPIDRDDAYDMLKSLSDKTHNVYTSITILASNYQQTHLDVARVTFKKLDDMEIENYLDTLEYVDKAGSYAIQGVGANLIHKFEGSFHTIMGFPIELFNQIYEKHFSNN